MQTFRLSVRLLVIVWGLAASAHAVAEGVPNGAFDQGGAGEPWVPAGWTNADGAEGFAPGELSLDTQTQFASGPCLEIDTRGRGIRMRRLFTRLNLIPGTLYTIAFKAVNRGDAPVTITLRKTPDSACTYFLDGGMIKPGWRGQYSGYHCIENPQPYLVIECREPAHVFLDDLSVQACADAGKRWNNYGQQRFAWDDTWVSLTNTVVTPHVPWARPLAGGPIRLVSLMPRWRQRWTVEIGQRLDAVCEPVMFADNHKLGAPFWVQGDGRAPVRFDPMADALGKVQAPSDCLIVGHLSASAIPSNLVHAVLQRVAEGAGLVIVGYGHPFWPYPDGRLPSCLEQFKTNQWALALCPSHATQDETDYVALGPVSWSANEFYRHGRGRIAYLREARVDGGVYELPTHPARSPTEPGCLLQFEHQQAYIAKAVLWAARRVPATRLSAMRLTAAQAADGLTASLDFDDQPGSLEMKLLAPEALKPGAVLRVWGVDAFGDGQFRDEQAIRAPAGTASVPLPRLKGGRHFLHAQLLEAGAVVDWSSMRVDVVSALAAPAIDMPPAAMPYARAGEDLRVRISPPDRTGKGLEAFVRLADTAGRVWLEEAWLAAEGPRTVVLSLPETAVRVYRLRAGLRDAAGVRVEREREFVLAPEAAAARACQDFQIWQLEGSDYLMGLLAAAMRREYGLTSVNYAHGPSHLNVRFNAWNNMRSTIALTGMPGSHNRVVGDARHAPVRDVCLSSAFIREHIVSRAAAITNVAPFAPLAYITDHEQNLRGVVNLLPPRADVCFSPTCLAELRRFLQAEYPGLGALNDAWGTDFASWNDVSPITLDDALARGQVARWVDHRRHMDRLWTDFTRARVEAVRRHDPGAVGISDNVRSGETVNDSFNGIDHWLLMSEATAGAASPMSYLTAFVPGDRRPFVWHRNAAWHPDVWTAEPDLLRERFGRGPWQALFEGAGGYTYWACVWQADPQNGNFETPMTPDLRATALGRMIARESALVRGGIDRFIMQGRCEDSGIGLYYSRPSEHVCTAWQAMQTPPGKDLAAQLDPRASQFGFFAAALKRTGRAFRSVAYGQVAREPGALQGLKLLILPFVQAMSPGEAAAIREFARNGGWVLADIRPAVCDQHGRCLPAGGLDDVFGLRQATALDAYVPRSGAVALEGGADGQSATGVVSDAIIGPSLDLVTARPRGACGATPAWLVHPFGKGGAVLLNFACLPAQADNRVLDARLEGLFADCNIPPLFGVDALDARWFTGDGELTPARIGATAASDTAARLATSEDGGEVEGIGFAGTVDAAPTRAVFRNGDIDAFAFWYDKGRGHGTQRVRIRPPRPGVVYDLRNGKTIGHVAGTFDITMPLEGLMAFAVCPAPIPGPLLSVGAGTDSRGRMVLRADGHVPGPEYAGQSLVLQFGIQAPDGGEAWRDFRAAHTTVNGRAAHAFVLPLNAPPGPWRVTVREPLSGLTATAAFTTLAGKE